MSTANMIEGDVQILTGSDAVTAGAEAIRESAFFRRPQRPADYNDKVLETARIIQGAFSGSYYGLGRLQEAMSTSDFPYYLGDVLGRELLPNYQAVTPVWSQYVRRSLVPDFRPKKFVDLLGGQEILERVGQGAPYPAGKLNDREYQLTVAKFGRRLPITFEAIVNDELGDFTSLPQRLAQAARNTEDYTIVGLHTTTAGPNPEFFNADNGNAPVNVELTVDSLQEAITTITSRKDEDGNPIVFPGLRLVVPPGLAPRAQNILNAVEIETTQGNRRLRSRNWLSSQIQLVIQHWLPVVDRSENANKTWYIFPDPNAARPALVAGFLRGRENPDLRVKADQGTAVGGGAISPVEGSFDNDTTDYRVRHILGGTTLDPIGTFVSTGG